MENVRIYEVKSTAAWNAAKLLSPEGKYFYLTSDKVSSLNEGDVVFVINQTGGWGLFTRIRTKNIQSRHEPQTKTSVFNFDYNTYKIDDPENKYKEFVQLEIYERVNLAATNWNWTKPLGRFEVFDIRKEGIENDATRKPRVHDLLQLFKTGEAAEVLDECVAFLNGETVTITADSSDKAVLQKSTDGNEQVMQHNKLDEQEALLLSSSLEREVDQLNFFSEIKIEQIIASPQIEEIVKARPFWFELGRKKLLEFIGFEIENEQIDLLLANLKTHTGSYEQFQDTFRPETQSRKLLVLIAEIVAYCDYNASGKRKYNLYSDYRVLAKASVRQNIWAENLLKYKLYNHDLSLISSSVIRNALSYLLKPEKGMTMLSEAHRSLVAENLLKRPYQPAEFVSQLVEFFTKARITPVNPENLTQIISRILYHPDVKPVWFEQIEGLVACESGNWIERVYREAGSKRSFIFWWDKMPSGKETLSLLRNQINRDGYFYVYLAINQEVYCRISVIDFATESDYSHQNWEQTYHPLYYQSAFSAYKEQRSGRKSGLAKARIVFLANELGWLSGKVPMSYFVFFKNHQPPTQNNLQPYSELNYNIEIDDSPVFSSSEKDSKSEQEVIPETNVLIPEELLPLTTTLAFDHPLRKLLMACRTKPFVLLAGISGTGKSRLVRELAYKTCALKSLQDKNAPGNFALIPVRPNWHDSTSLLGYSSRLSGKEYVVTDFLRFLIKAWKESRIPFFLCLDEMNLAPVEHYFAEFLSLIETRDFRDGKVMADPFLTAEKLKEHPDILQKLNVLPGTELYNEFMHSGLGFPPNLVVIGTVNMDETTHSFSRKVLDRAMTIELNQVDLLSGLDAESSAWSYPDEYLSPQFVLGHYTSGRQVYSLFKDKADELLERLVAVNKELEGTPFKIAYRVRDELLIYSYFNSQLENTSDEWLDKCFDEFIVMKVLSRIEGDDRKAGDVLDGLKKEMTRLNGIDSLAKIAEMQKRLNGGYTSYWA
ncbi:MAG: McrB family protein [Bacteroidota bacterium]|jgi:hypothetical protein